MSVLGSPYMSPNLGTFPGAGIGMGTGAGSGGALGGGTPGVLGASSFSPQKKAQTGMADPFAGINMSVLQSQFPLLYDKIAKYQSGRGQLGQNYQFTIGNLGRAISAPDPFQQNDIRNAAQALQNKGASEWYNENQGLGMQAALSDSSNSGAAHKYIAQQGAAANEATQQAEQQTVNSLLGYNAQYRQQQIQQAVDALNQWAAARRARRQAEAGAGAMAAYGSTMASAQNQAAMWGLGSSLLSSGSSVAGAYALGGK